MSFWLSAHQYVFRVGLLITVIAGLWGLVMYFRKQPASGGYRSLLVITEGVFIVQGLIGIVLVLGGRRPHDGLHWLYGILLVIALPIAATYASGHEGRRESLVYGIAGLFMAGLAVRALTTGA